MSGNCSRCAEHTLDCKCLGKTLNMKRKNPNQMVKVTMDLKDATELIFWARRYCDGRATYAALSFNQILKRIRSENESVIMNDTFDQTLKDAGLHWPFAQDGMYDAQNGIYDATI